VSGQSGYMVEKKMTSFGQTVGRMDLHERYVNVGMRSVCVLSAFFIACFRISTTAACSDANKQ
jgi:hypothetical protein